MTLSSQTLGDDVALYIFVVQCTVYKSKYINSYITFFERLLGVDSRLHSGWFGVQHSDMANAGSSLCEPYKGKLFISFFWNYFDRGFENNFKLWDRFISDST